MHLSSELSVLDVFPGRLLLKNRENCLVKGKVEIRVYVMWEVGGSGSIAGEALGSIEEGPCPRRPGCISPRMPSLAFDNTIVLFRVDINRNDK